ncbi:MAG: hypothetical protein IT168_19720 [Bryobacterales bacterium]|nr:hypothetical protein [Bryobacterales bacterium]
MSCLVLAHLAAMAAVTVGPQPATVIVPIPKHLATAPFALLRVAGIHPDAEQGAVLRIFFGHPRATRATSVNDPRYAGAVTILPPTGGRPRNVMVSPSRKLWERVRNQGNVQVTLVPMNQGKTQVETLEFTTGE